jgi:hypothetical protein
MTTTLRMASLALLFSVTTLGSGCAVRNFRGVPTGTSRGAVVVKEEGGSSRKECHPSQYWDGDSCKHKGKGKGARKHDD